MARTRQVEMPYTWVYKYSSMIADHVSTCGGLNRAAIVADGRVRWARAVTGPRLRSEPDVKR